MQNSCDTLPVELEALIVKIYKSLRIYTFHVSELQRFCDTEHATVLQPGISHFLSLFVEMGENNRNEWEFESVFCQRVLVSVLRDAMNSVVGSAVSASEVANEMITATGRGR